MRAPLGLAKLGVVAVTVAVAGLGSGGVGSAGAGAGARSGPCGSASGSAPAVSSLRVAESREVVRDAAGRTWAPDRRARGGALVTSTAQVFNTRAPALYQGQRLGIRSIDVPVRSARPYLVVLYFAETRGARAGQRVFDVLAQGRRVGTVDIARDVGAGGTYHLAFTAAAPRRCLSLRFVARRGRPVLSALSLQPAPTGLVLPAPRLIWSDDFNGSAGASPNPAKWTFDTGPGWNQEADYTARPANASLDGAGHLLIQAQHDDYADPAGGTYPITSARMTTAGLFQVSYGLVEGRIKIAAQGGVVSTFWGLRTDVDRLPWPYSGEIDPEEVRGVAPDVHVQAFHMPCGRKDCPIVWEHHLSGSLAAGYHTFAYEHAPGAVVYFRDGRQTASLTSADVAQGSWVFDRPFYLILNLIVGSGWSGRPSMAGPWPVTMSVDWVRVFG